VNRWADQHAAALAVESDDGEQLLVAARVALARRPRAGPNFPVPGRVFVLGLSDRRLLFWSASRWFGRPAGFATSVDLDQVTSLELVRRLGTSRLRLILAVGSVLSLEPTWGGSIHALSDTFQALRSHR